MKSKPGAKRQRKRTAPRRRGTSRARSRPPRWRRHLWRLGALMLVVVVALLAYLDVTIRRQFEGKRWALPAHVYTRPLELYAGQRLTPQRLLTELRDLGYRASAEPQQPGTYREVAEGIEVHIRGFTFWDGPRPAMRLRVRFDDGRVGGLTASGGERVDVARLEPRLFGSVSPVSHEDRALVRLEQVPPALVEGLLAVEDRSFYRHIGIDPKGLARAMWTNLSAGGWVQGGSTITQQLVKNFYLNADRTLRRKFVEMVMALLLEVHYDKNEILETYINEVYLGQAGNRAIHGFGLASVFYFGRPLEELNVAEVAMLVGLVKGPSYFNPRQHPQRALERRNLVLSEMQELGYLKAAAAVHAQRAPLGVAQHDTASPTAYPAFLDFVRSQLRRDYREEDLNGEGLRIFTTLDPAVQHASEEAVATRLKAIERARHMRPGTLEAAAVVVHSDNGEVLAMVGGRSPRYAGFNRAVDAERPVGSLIKPAVFLAALERGTFTLASLIDDGPLTVRQRGAADWSPQNYDKTDHGEVMLIDALANSYNVATARLGMQVGLPEVVATLHRLGVRRPLDPYPSLLLGAVSMAPVEIAQLYLTFANNGFLTPLRATLSIWTNDGRPLARYPLSVEQVVEPSAMALLNHALKEVVRSGTARGLSRWLGDGPELAGKTGTTDGFRDSWFAGYSGDQLVVVWVGRDDNEPTGLSGASGAMQVWADIMRALDPLPLLDADPEDIERVQIDRASGRLADDGCPDTTVLPFIAGSAPTVSADCASAKVSGKVGGRLRTWFKRLFRDADG